MGTSILPVLKKCIKYFRDHRWFLIGITFLILVFAGCNYIHINSNINHNYEAALNILERVDSLSRLQAFYVSSDVFIEKFDSLTNKPMESFASFGYSSEITALRQILYDMSTNKKGIFDSNVITFLISFVLVGLIAIFFENDRKIADKIKEISEHRMRMSKEVSGYQGQLNLYQESAIEDQQIAQFINNIQTIQLIAIQINIELTRTEVNLAGPINEYARMIDTETEQLIQTLNSGLVHTLSILHKDIILNMLNKVMTYVSSDNIVNVESQVIISKALLSTQQHLYELYQRIDQLPIRTQRVSEIEMAKA